MSIVVLVVVVKELWDCGYGSAVLCRCGAGAVVLGYFERWEIIGYGWMQELRLG